MESCIFCKIANKEIPSKVIYEDEKCLVFLDISPATKGHVLIIPKNHYADLFEIEESELFYLMGIAQKISQRLKDRLGFEGLKRAASAVLLWYFRSFSPHFPSLPPEKLPEYP